MYFECTKEMEEYFVKEVKDNVKINDPEHTPDHILWKYIKHSVIYDEDFVFKEINQPINEFQPLHILDNGYDGSICLTFYLYEPAYKELLDLDMIYL